MLVPAGAYLPDIFFLLFEDPPICFLSSSDQFDVDSVRNLNVLDLFSHHFILKVFSTFFWSLTFDTPEKKFFAWSGTYCSGEMKPLSA